MIHLEPMKVEDVHDFLSWGSFQEEIFQDYNFDLRSPQEEKDWFLWKTGQILASYQTIFLNEKPIGYLGFKHRFSLLGMGVLGICLGAHYVGQGYGQEALKIFFDQAFIQDGLRVIYLLVAPYNSRAIHVYKKFGFQEVGSKYFAYGGKDLPKDLEEDRDLFDQAYRIFDQWYLPGIKMKLKKKWYLERRGV